MQEQEIRSFWNAHPCGEDLVGGGYDEDLAAFFAKYDAFRYRTEGHILGCLDALALDGKKVLEIGLGQGADSEQLIRRGAAYTGVDLTPESIERVTARFRLRDLPYDALVNGSALELPFPDDSFDLVYSHGVLHHIPDIRTAQAEIHRVLKPGGELVAMLYARRSVNYLLSIKILRRVGLAGLLALGMEPEGKIGDHVRLAKAHGPLAYLRMRNFIHRSTDGPHNPYAKVYGLREVREDFPKFTITRSHREFMHAPPLPVQGLPGASLLGWHLWVHLSPR